MLLQATALTALLEVTPRHKLPLPVYNVQLVLTSLLLEQHLVVAVQGFTPQVLPAQLALQGFIHQRKLLPLAQAVQQGCIR